MKPRLLLVFCLFSISSCLTQTIVHPDHINLNELERNRIHKKFLGVGHDALGNEIKLPILIAKGSSETPVLGLTAAIHGNELNGVKIIHDVFKEINVDSLQGIIVAVPGLNPLGISNFQREYVDGTDLNRIFPGKANGNRSEQLVHQIATKIIPYFDYHIDLHTASFGRVNTLYGRGDMGDQELAQMLTTLQPEIVVSNRGNPSFGSSKSMTLRAYATSQGIKSITMEFGNPQVFQKKMIEKGVKGIQDVMVHLNMIKGQISPSKLKYVCDKSYWLYTKEGGYLEVLVELGDLVGKNQRIAILRDSFGEMIKEYRTQESGIVIGKSTNPVSISGSRIIHLGVLSKKE